jgi:hypothetical protein
MYYVDLVMLRLNAYGAKPLILYSPFLPLSFHASKSLTGLAASLLQVEIEKLVERLLSNKKSAVVSCNDSDVTPSLCINSPEKVEATTLWLNDRPFPILDSSTCLPFEGLESNWK